MLFYFTNTFFIACQVLALAYIGISYFRDRTPTPFMWSICSWVTNIPFIDEGDSFIRSKANSMLLPESPASISIFDFSEDINMELPLLPL